MVAVKVDVGLKTGIENELKQSCKDGPKITALILDEYSEGVPHRLRRIIPGSVCATLVLRRIISLCLSKAVDLVHNLILSFRRLRMKSSRKYTFFLSANDWSVFYVFVPFSHGDVTILFKALLLEPHYLMMWSVILRISWWKCHWPDLKSAGPFSRNLFLNSLKTSTY